MDNPSKKDVPWKLTKLKYAYKDPFVKVRKDEVVGPSGKPSTFSWIERGDMCLVIPLADDGDFYMIYHYRYPTQSYSLEFPEGFVDKGEKPEESAKRELKEEIGATAESWQSLRKYSLGPGLTEQQAHIFLAKDLTMGEPKREENEEMEVLKVSMDQFKTKLESGEIHDGPTIVGFHFFLNK
jgi:ADP-ribose pyrophosphatase